MKVTITFNEFNETVIHNATYTTHEEGFYCIHLDAHGSIHKYPISRIKHVLEDNDEELMRRKNVKSHKN